MTPRSGHPGLEVPDLYLGLSKPPALQASTHLQRQTSHGYAESDEATATALQLLRSGDGGVYQQRAPVEDAAAALLDRHAAECCLDTQSPDTPGAVSGRVWPYSVSPFEQTTPPARDVALPLRSDSQDDMFGGAAGGVDGAADHNSSLDSAMGSPLAGGSPMGEQLWAAPVTSRPLAQHIRPLHRGARAGTLSGPLSTPWDGAAGGVGMPVADDGCVARSPGELWGAGVDAAAVQGVRHTFAARRARSMVQLDVDNLLMGRSTSLHSTSYKTLSASSRTSLKTTGAGGGPYVRGALRHSRSAAQLYNAHHAEPLMAYGGGHHGSRMPWSPVKAAPEVAQEACGHGWQSHGTPQGPHPLSVASPRHGDGYSDSPAASGYHQLEMAAALRAGIRSPSPAVRLSPGSLPEHAIPEGSGLQLGGWGRGAGLRVMPQFEGVPLNPIVSSSAIISDFWTVAGRRLVASSRRLFKSRRRDSIAETNVALAPR